MSMSPGMGMVQGYGRGMGMSPGMGIGQGYGRGLIGGAKQQNEKDSDNIKN